MESTPLFKNGTIRRLYDQVSQKWHFSIVDVISLIINTSNPRNYWKVLKNRLNKTNKQLVTNCNQLKMRANDGKYYLTDTADAITLHKIIESISVSDASLFWRYIENLESYDGSTALSEDTLNSSPNTAFRYGYPQDRSSELKSNENEKEYELPIDAYLDNDFIIIKTLIAGVPIEKIFIKSTCDTLFIKIDNDDDTPSDSAFHLHEISRGKFSRQIKLPYEIEVDEIEATEYHGLLTIKLPIIDKQYSRQIKIRSI